MRPAMACSAFRPPMGYGHGNRAQGAVAMISPVRYNVSLSVGNHTWRWNRNRQSNRSWTMANGKGLGAGCYYPANPMNLLDAKSVRWSPAARLDMFAVSLSTLVRAPLRCPARTAGADASGCPSCGERTCASCAGTRCGSRKPPGRLEGTAGRRQQAVRQCGIGWPRAAAGGGVHRGSVQVRAANHRCRRRAPWLGTSLALGATVWQE